MDVYLTLLTKWCTIHKADSHVALSVVPLTLSIHVEYFLTVEVSDLVNCLSCFL